MKTEWWLKRIEMQKKKLDLRILKALEKHDATLVAREDIARS